MNNRLVLVALAALLFGAAACSKPPGSNIGLVDVPRITANWPKFLNYQNQLNADLLAVQHSNASDTVKARQTQGLQLQYQADQSELTSDVRSAAQQVAANEHLSLVVTRQFVGYGGVDITPDVEKVLNITEKATPAP
jgi:Skp family chaperone for outer membrane proteins